MNLPVDTGLAMQLVANNGAVTGGATRSRTGLIGFAIPHVSYGKPWNPHACWANGVSYSAWGDLFHSNLPTFYQTARCRLARM